MSDMESEDRPDLHPRSADFLEVMRDEIEELIDFRARLGRIFEKMQDSDDRKELIARYEALIEDRVEDLCMKLAYLEMADEEAWNSLQLSSLDLRYFNMGQLTENTVLELRNHVNRSLARLP